MALLSPNSSTRVLRGVGRLKKTGRSSLGQNCIEVKHFQIEPLEVAHPRDHSSEQEKLLLRLNMELQLGPGKVGRRIGKPVHYWEVVPSIVGAFV